MQLQPFHSAAAWDAAELQKRSDWETRFSADELAEIDAALNGVADIPVTDITPAQFSLPTLPQRLLGIQDSLENGTGAVWLKGIPVERYSLEDLRRIFWGLLCHLGTPISQSATGEKIFSVCNEGLDDQDAKTRGPNTKKKLSFHTDRCDVIGFLCVQPALTGGENEIVSSVAVYNEILATRPDLLEVLAQPFYYRRHNVDLGNEQLFTQQPIFSIHQGHFAANFLRVLIQRAYDHTDTPEMTAAQREALDYLETVAAQPSLKVTFRQEAGDVVLLNNFVTFHRRTAFDDDAAKPRHLLRIWLAVPNSRPLDPMFAGNYGSVAAGAIRGGMKPQDSHASHAKPRRAASSE